MKPLFNQEVRISDKLSYHTFLKKGLRTFSRLTLKKATDSYSSGLYPRDPKNMKLVRVFKKIKLTRKVDLKQLHITNPIPSSSAFLYIAKRMLHVKDLSILDSRRKETKYKGLYTTWPKYMKQLKSLYSEITIDKKSRNFADAPQILPMKFPSNFLRFLPRFEEAKMWRPYFLNFSEMDKICQLEKYPVSLRRVSILNSIYNSRVFDISITYLKDLRDLEIIVDSSSSALLKSAYGLISQAPVELQALNVKFLESYEIDDSIEKSIRRLTNLKKAKFNISSAIFPGNLRLLQSLEQFPLKSLNLNIRILHDEDVLTVKELISKKKNTLKRLRLSIDSDKGKLINLSFIIDLIKTIEDLPQLIDLSFALLISLKTARRDQLISLESSLSFRGLLFKPIPLRKLKLRSAGFLSGDRFLDLLKYLGERGVCSNLEKLQISLGKYKPTKDTDAETIINFICSLAKIQVLALDDLCVRSKDFLKITEAILTLRNLTVLSIGKLAEEIPEDELVQGIGKILRKHGLRTLHITVSLELDRISDKIREEYSSCLKVIDIKKKNPYFIYCSESLEFPDSREKVWC